MPSIREIDTKNFSSTTQTPYLQWGGRGRAVHPTVKDVATENEWGEKKALLHLVA